MITPEHAARIAGVSARRIYAWAESGKLHFAETPEGSLLICLDSILDWRSGRGPGSDSAGCSRGRES